MMAFLIEFGGPLLALLGAMLGVGGLWYGGKAKARAVAQEEAATQRAADAEALAVKMINDNNTAHAAEVNSVVKANETLSEVSNMSDADVIDELRTRWTRKGTGDNSGSGS